jgi:vacuolar-type H+-ATPase subunit H
MSKYFESVNPYDPDIPEAHRGPRRKSQIPKKKKPKKESGYKDFQQGLLHSMLKMGYGIQDLASMIPGDWVDAITDQERQNLADLREDAMESGWGTGGQILGEIAQFATPGGMFLKGAKALNKARGVGKLAGVRNIAAAEAAAGGATAAARLPGEGENRGTNAAYEALFSLGGSAASATVGKAIQGATISPMAKKLRDRGRYLTPGASAPSVSQLENAMSRFIPTGKGTKKRWDKMTQGFREDAYKSANPTRQQILSDGKDAAKQLSKIYNDEYKRVWSYADTISKKSANKAVDILDRAHPFADEATQKILDSARHTILDMYTKKSAKQLNIVDRNLSELLSTKAVRNNHELSKAIKVVKKVLRKNLGKESREELAYLDTKWPEYKVVREAGGSSKAHLKGGEFDIEEYAAADKKYGGEKTGLGESPGEHLIKEASKTLEHVGKDDAIGFWGKLAEAVPSPPMDMLGNAVIGETAYQKFLKKWGVKTPSALKASRTAPSVMRPFYDVEED